MMYRKCLVLISLAFAVLAAQTASASAQTVLFEGARVIPGDGSRGH